MTKKEALERWNRIEENLPILPHMEAIAYKASGSKYGACGIRIDGNPQFVDAVLSHLKELIAGECVETRLELSRNPVDCKLEGHDFRNKCDQSECCYIRLHKRGSDGEVMRSIMNNHSKKVLRRRGRGKAKASAEQGSFL